MSPDTKPTVLVVDDTPQNIELLEEVLREHYRVQVALNGRRALELANSDDPPNLILLDVMMPEMDGQAVCRKLQEHPKTAKIPVIFVTARSEVQDEIAGFKVGAVDYITKPISPPVVLARVRNHLLLSQTKLMLENAVRQRTAQLRAMNQKLESEVRRREEAINRAEHLSQYDQLTGLPNRRQLQERLRAEIKRAREKNETLSLIRLNFDRMQALNNTFGPSAGDAAMALGTRRLRSGLEANDFFAREDGDNFIVITGDSWPSTTQAREAALAKTRKILAQLQRPLNLGDSQVSLSASAGVVIFPEDASTPDRMLARAQSATAAAKARGRGQVVSYSPEIGDDIVSKFSLEGRLRKALKTDGLEIHFQPQLEIARSRYSGAEALVRWPDGEGGYISNSKFIPVAEDAGMIIELDHYVLKALCDHVLAWGMQLPAGFRMGFNFSSVGFQDPGCAERIMRTIQESGLPAHRFELEVTEQAVMTDFSSAIEKLQQLQEFGVAIALDDFGTGYSSLAYLQQLPLDRLKIDRTFIREIETNAKAASIARAIIKLARTLGLDCLIEGIETHGQLEFCRLNGAQHVQGYFLCRPQPATALIEAISKSGAQLKA